MNDDLVTNSDWHEEAEKKFPQAFGELMQKIEDLENQEDDSCIDELVSLLTERPKNLPDPVFSRFMTVLMCTKVVTANWPIISLWQLQWSKTSPLAAIYGSFLFSSFTNEWTLHSKQ